MRIRRLPTVGVLGLFGVALAQAQTSGITPSAPYPPTQLQSGVSPYAPHPVQPGATIFGTTPFQSGITSARINPEDENAPVSVQQFSQGGAATVPGGDNATQSTNSTNVTSATSGKGFKSK